VRRASCPSWRATYITERPSCSSSDAKLWRRSLIATADAGWRAFLATQLDADGHTVYEVEDVAGAIAKLSAHAIDILVLGNLGHPAQSPALVRTIRAGPHPRVHSGQPVITLGAGDELTALRAYESGTDHHLPDNTGYVLLRSVIATVMRRADEQASGRHLQVGDIHIDLAARTVDVAGTMVHVSRLEFELLVKFAVDPTRVVGKHALARCIWRRQHVNGRTIDSHVARLRTRLAAAGLTTCSSTSGGKAGRSPPPRRVPAMTGRTPENARPATVVTS
jgi:DNA-binding response OmpR family regulator